MAMAAGATSNATAYAAAAASIETAMLGTMWDERQQRFCDGPCNDTRVAGHGGVTTNYFTAFFDLVPAASVGAVWKQLAEAGLEGIGDYGAHIFINALGRHATDDGAAMLTALTKCDAFSWCAEMQVYNATMVTESLGTPHATMSHPWGTAPISGVVHGVMGVKQTAPTWSTFTVRPRLATLQWANVTVPTIRGPLVVAATPTMLSVRVPCNTAATLCVQHAYGEELPTLFASSASSRTDAGVPAPALMLVMDGAEVAATRSAHHLCTVEPVGCAVDGVMRSLSAVVKGGK